MDRKKLKFISCKIVASETLQNVLKKIEEVEIVNCEIEPAAFRTKASDTMRKLVIRDCKITEEHIFHLSMRELQTLSLYGNNIKNIVAINFDNIGNIETLNLGKAISLS